MRRTTASFSSIGAGTYSLAAAAAVAPYSDMRYPMELGGVRHSALRWLDVAHFEGSPSDGDQQLGGQRYGRGVYLLGPGRKFINS